MPLRATSIRLFVSSTFQDFQRERRILDEEVFPYIQRLCIGRGVQFQPVDLRWGISEDEALSQRTLQVCLNEVTRCVQASLHPCFLALIGSRYGWQPLPAQIEASEFEALLARVPSTPKPGQADSDAGLLRRWYRLDDNQIPPHVTLQPRRGGAAKRAVWEPIEARLRAALRAAAAWLPAEAADKYHLAATAHEIARAVLSPPAPGARTDLKENVLCFVRRRLNVPPTDPLPLDEVFDDLLPDGQLDTDARARLAALTERIKMALGDNVLTYQKFVADKGASPADEERYERTFAADARRLLTALVQRQLDQLEKLREVERESLWHEEVGERLCHNLVGRADLIAQVDDFLDRRDGRALVMHGKGGIGKSTLVAKAAAMAADPLRGFVTVQRFVGASAGSSGSAALIASLLEQLRAKPAQGPASTDLTQLALDLRNALADASTVSARGVLLAIDALDQLPDTDPSRGFEWLPWPLPDGVALLVSVLDGALLDQVLRRLPGATTLAVGPLEKADGSEMLASLLRERDRRIQPAQEQALLRSFDGERSPLYLRLAATFAERWPSYLLPDDQALDLPSSTIGLIGHLVKDLSAARGHSARLVNRALAFLCASRQGLTEGELTALLWKDDEIRGEVEAHAGMRDLPQLHALPMIHWSRLRDDLEPFLTDRSADGTVVLAWFHRIFHESLQARLLAGDAAADEVRTALKQHFNAEPLLVGAGNATRPNLRKLSELPHQLYKLRDGVALRALLASDDYFATKLSAGRGIEYYLELRQCAHLLGGEEPTDKEEDDSAAAERARVRAGVRDELAKLLVDRVVAVASRNDRKVPFSAEELHVNLVYARRCPLYGPFLARVTRRLAALRHRGDTFDELHTIFSARQGNVRRRANELEKARAQLTELIPPLRRRKLWVEVSRAEYDLGYVEMLLGRAQPAIRLFERSASSARRGGNLVSEAISLCLAAHTRWNDAISRRHFEAESAMFIEVLNRSEEVFRRALDTDANAARWISNVRIDRFRVAFRTGNLALARLEYGSLREDAWMRAHDQLAAIEPQFLARLALLEGRFADGALALEKLLPNVQRTGESAAEWYFDAGMAFVAAGDLDKARALWAQGLAIDAESRLGNAPWHRLIRAAMSTYT